MTMVLHLTPEQEARLKAYAEFFGKDTETILQEVVEKLPLPSEDAPPQKRIAGLHEGNILYIADDFDDPLPDEFWDSPVFPEAPQ